MSRSTRRILLKLHHRVGLAIAAFAVVLSITGILINHANSLGWDKRRLVNGFWLDLYGVERSGVETGYRVGEHWVSSAGSQLYLDDKPVVECASPLSGAVMMPDTTDLGQGAIALCGQSVVLFTLAGELIEKIPLTGQTLRKLALKGDVIYSANEEGLMQFSLDTGVWSSVVVDPSGVIWSHQESLPEALRERLRYANAPADLTWERLLQDLHSGRLFGPFGVWMVDLAGVLMVALALTGLWSVVTRKR